MGLLDCAERREFHEDGIRRVKYYSLSERGHEIAMHVRSISHLLVQHETVEIPHPMPVITE